MNVTLKNADAPAHPDPKGEEPGITKSELASIHVYSALLSGLIARNPGNIGGPAKWMIDFAREAGRQLFPEEYTRSY